MTDAYTVLGVDEVFPTPDASVWRFTMERPDGGLHNFFVPKYVPAARAVEYKIDPEDVDTLYDVMMHEPFMVHPEDRKSVAMHGDPAEDMGLTFEHWKLGEIGVTCHYAERRETAQAAHLARLDACKGGIIVVRDPKEVGNVVRRHKLHRHWHEMYEEEFKDVRTRTREANRDAIRRRAQVR